MTFKNEFRWSHSRQGNFEKCRRLYYLRYYAMWGGWRSSAKPIQRLCYRLSKMTNQYMLPGSIVHDAVEWCLKIVELGRSPTLNDVKEMAINKARRAWRESTNQVWLHDPKYACNLFEHYYGREIDTERMKATIEDCLNNFYTYALPIIMSCKDSWKSLEEFQNFNTDYYTLGLKMDLAYELDGRIHIIDWKTGSPNEAVKRQLMVYALYASRQWGYAAGDIQITAFYLRTNKVESVIPAEESLAERLEQIDAQVNEMAAYLVDCDLERNEPLSPKMFPRTEGEWKCGNCFYREVCYGR